VPGSWVRRIVSRQFVSERVGFYPLNRWVSTTAQGLPAYFTRFCYGVPSPSEAALNANTIVGLDMSYGEPGGGGMFNEVLPLPRELR
jgi:hypothetical protein